MTLKQAPVKAVYIDKRTTYLAGRNGGVYYIDHFGAVRSSNIFESLGDVALTTGGTMVYPGSKVGIKTEAQGAVSEPIGVQFGPYTFLFAEEGERYVAILAGQVIEDVDRDLNPKILYSARKSRPIMSGEEILLNV